MDTEYVETSIISYLRQKPGTQVVLAARQLLTHQWWNDERRDYQSVASQFVIDEASAGDPTLAAERLQLLAGIPLLPLDPVIADIADEIMSRYSSRKGSYRCFAYRHGCSSSNTILADMELQAYCQCQNPATYP